MRLKNKPLALALCGVFELCLLWLIARTLTTGRVVAEFGHAGLGAGGPAQPTVNHVVVLGAMAAPIRYWGSLALFVAAAVVVGYFFVALARSPASSARGR